MVVVEEWNSCSVTFFFCFRGRVFFLDGFTHVDQLFDFAYFSGMVEIFRGSLR